MRSRKRNLMVGAVLGVGFMWILTSNSSFAQVTKFEAPPDPKHFDSKIPSAQVIAKVNNVPIYVSDFQNAVIASGRPETPQLRSEIKQRLIANEVLRQAAQQAGLDQDPEVLTAIDNAKRAAETRLYLSKNIGPMQISESRIRSRYEAIVSSLGSNEYKLRIITVANPEKAKTIQSGLSNGVPFDVLAGFYSEAPSKSDGGALPWISFSEPPKDGHSGGLPLVVAQTIVGMRPGETKSDPITSDGQIIFFKLDEKRPTYIPSYEDSRPEIRAALEQDARRSAIDQLLRSLIEKASIQQISE